MIHSKKLPSSEADILLKNLPGWKRQGDQIHKIYSFPDYTGTLSFVKQVAGIAEEMDHHPEIRFGYNRCEVIYTTHSAEGLTKKDFAAAEQINRL